MLQDYLSILILNSTYTPQGGYDVQIKQIQDIIRNRD